MKFRHLLLCWTFQGIYCAAAWAIVAQAASRNPGGVLVDPNSTYISFGLLVAGVGAAGLFAWNVRGTYETLKNETKRNRRVTNENRSRIDAHIVECGEHREAMNELGEKVETLLAELRKG